MSSPGRESLCSTSSADYCETTLIEDVLRRRFERRVRFMFSSSHQLNSRVCNRRTWDEFRCPISIAAPNEANLRPYLIKFLHEGKDAVEEIFDVFFAFHNRDMVGATWANLKSLPSWLVALSGSVSFSNDWSISRPEKRLVRSPMVFGFSMSVGRFVA